LYARRTTVVPVMRQGVRPCHDRAYLAVRRGCSRTARRACSAGSYRRPGSAALDCSCRTNPLR